MAQQNAPCLGTIKMKGFSRADLNRQPLDPEYIDKKSADCIDTRNMGVTFVQPIGLTTGYRYRSSTCGSAMSA